MTLEELKKHLAEEREALLKAATEAATKAVAESLKVALPEALKGVNAEIETLKKSKATPEPKKGKGKKGEKSEDDPEGDAPEADDEPAYVEELREANKKLMELVTPIAEDRSRTAKAEAAKKLLATIAEKTKQPGLLSRPKLLNDLIRAGVSDEASAQSVVDEYIADLKTSGADIKALQSASPAGEGAKASDADKTDRESQIKANVEAATKLRKQTF